MDQRVEIVPSIWRVFPVAADVFVGGQVRAIIAQGTDDQWSVWNPGGGYVQGHLGYEEAVEIAASVPVDPRWLMGPVAT